MTLHADVTSVLLGFFDVFLIELCTNLIRFDLGSHRIDKSSFSISSLLDESDEKLYWLSKSPLERLEAVELMRQINYGYDPSSRLQRILTM
jgi:hypothetical protein